MEKMGNELSLILDSNDEFSEFRQLIEEIKDIPGGLDVEVAIRGLINLIPTVGGCIEKFLFANKDKREKKQILFFLYILYGQLHKIGREKIDLDYLKTDEFYVLFKRILDKVRYEHRQEKIQLFKNFLIKSSFKKEFAPTEGIDKEYMLHRLGNLNLIHFQIIEWYFKNGYTSKNLGAEYMRRKNKGLSKFSKYHKEYENDLASIGFFESTSANIVAGGHYYMPSSLCKIFYDFIKYDDL